MRVDATAFKRAVERCASIIEKKGRLPILRHILMVIEPGRLTMTATNLDDWFSIQIPCQSDVTLTLALDAATLLALVKQAKSGEVTLTYAPETQKCTAALGDVSVSVPVADPEEFPKIPAFSPERHGVDVTLGDQKQCFRLLKDLTPFCCRPDENRTYSGVLTIAQNDGIHLVSTDIHRLNVAIMSSGSVPAPFVMSRSSCDRLVKIFGDVPIEAFRILGEPPNESEKEEKPFTPSHAIISGESQWLMTRLLVNDFPQYQHVINLSRINGPHIKVDRKQFMQKLKSFIDILKNEKYVATTLEYIEGTLYVTVRGDDENQTMETELSATPVNLRDDESCLTAVNGRYFLQALKSFSQEKVRLSIEDGLRPIYLMEEDENGRRYNLTMPFRVELKSRRPQPEPQPEEQQQELASEMAVAA